MLSLNFIFLFLAVSCSLIVVLVGIGESTNSNCSEPNCDVSFGGADCVECSKPNNSNSLIISLLPLSLVVAVYFIFTGFSGKHPLEIFGGVGGKPSGGVIPVKMFYEEQPRKEDGWIGVGDFKNGI